MLIQFAAENERRKFKSVRQNNHKQNAASFLSLLCYLLLLQLRLPTVFLSAQLFCMYMVQWKLHDLTFDIQNKLSNQNSIPSVGHLNEEIGGIHPSHVNWFQNIGLSVNACHTNGSQSFQSLCCSWTQWTMFRVPVRFFKKMDELYFQFIHITPNFNANLFVLFLFVQFIIKPLEVVVYQAKLT